MDPSIPLTARILLILVFGTAMLGKLRHRDEFVGVVANYRLLPQPLVVPVAWLIITSELMVVLSLTTGFMLAAGSLLAIALLAAFAAAIAINLARGRRHIDCGCFQSALRQRLSASLVARNAVLIVIALPVLEYAMRSSPAAPDIVGLRAMSLFQAMNGVGAGLVLFVLYQFFEQALAIIDVAAALRKRFT